jgi:hypothetical protein
VARRLCGVNVAPHMDERRHDVLRCDHCGQVIGVYEPVTVLAGGVARETSVAADPALRTSTGPRYHRICFAARGGGGDDSHGS